MSEDVSESTPKNSKRLVFKITSLSLAGLCALLVVAYISFQNYKNYNVLLEEKEDFSQQLSVIDTLQGELARLQKDLPETRSMVSFASLQAIIQNVDASFVTLKKINNALLSKAFSEFLDIKKQVKILQSLLIKQAATQNKVPLNQKQLDWLTEQSTDQKTRLTEAFPSLLKNITTLQEQYNQENLLKKKSVQDFEVDALNNLYMILGLLALAILFTHIIAAYFISKPLGKLMQRMRDLNDGNINEEIHGTNRSDEFGDIARMLHDFRENALKIGQMQEHLQQTIEESKKSNQLKNQFMARMSQELRTPLSAIIGYSEMIVDSVDDKMDLKQLRNDINKIASAGQNLLSMVDSVLELTDDSDDNIMKTEKFNVLEEVQQVLPALEVVILKNKNKFKVNCPDATLSMHSDPKKIKRVLINLLKNAANFTENGQLTLDIIAANLGDLEAVCFKVKDTGCGIEASKVGTLFGAFENNTSSSGTSQSGVGLGLAIVKKITDELHGQVSVDSTLNQGSTFTIILPCNHYQADERAQKIMLSPLADAV